EMLRALHTLKGAAGVVGAEELQNLLHTFEEQVRLLEKQAGEIDAEPMERLGALLEGIYRAVGEAGSVERLTPPADGAGDAEGQGLKALARAAGDLLRVRPEKVEALQTLASELTISRLRYESLAKRLLDLRDPIDDAISRLGLLTSSLRQRRGPPSKSDWK